MYDKFVKLFINGNTLLSHVFTDAQIAKYSKQFVLCDVTNQQDKKIIYDKWTIDFNHNHIEFMYDNISISLTPRIDDLYEYQFISSKMLYYVLTKFNKKGASQFFNLIQHGNHLLIVNYNKLLTYYGHDIMTILLLMVFDNDLIIGGKHSFEKTLCLFDDDNTYTFIGEWDQITEKCLLQIPTDNGYYYSPIPSHEKMLYHMYNHIRKFIMTFNG